LIEKGLDVVGLLRIPGSQEEVNSLRKKVDEGQEFSFQDKDPHDVAGLLKSFLREMPQPLIPSSSNARVNALVNNYLKDKDKKGTDLANLELKLLEELRQVLERLPRPNYDILKYLVQFLRIVVAHEETNLMPIDNIIKCIVPTVRCAPAFFFYPITHYDFFFEGRSLPQNGEKLVAIDTQWWGKDGAPSEEFLKLMQREEEQYKKKTRRANPRQ